MICHIATRRIPTYFLNSAYLNVRYRDTRAFITHKKDKENQKHWNAYSSSRSIHDYHGHITSFITWMDWYWRKKLMPGSFGIKVFFFALQDLKSVNVSDVVHTHTKDLVLHSISVLYSPITCVQFCYGFWMAYEECLRIAGSKYALKWIWPVLLFQLFSQCCKHLFYYFRVCIRKTDV